MPPGGDGFYYFSVFLMGQGAEIPTFDVELNGEFICTVYSDLTESVASDEEATSCNAIAQAGEGMYDIDALSFSYYLQTKLREGNIFRGVCLSTEGF